MNSRANTAYDPPQIAVMDIRTKICYHDITG